MNSQVKNNKTLLKGAFGVLATRASNAVITFVLILVLAKLLGPAELGVYSINIALVSIFSTIAVFGFDQYLVRHIAIAIIRGNPAMASGLAWRALLLVSLFSLFWLGVLSLGLFIFTPRNTNSYAIALVLVPCVAVLRVLSGAMLGHGLVITSYVPEYIVLTSLHLAAVAILTFGFFVELQASDVLFWRVVGAVGALLVACVLFTRFLHSDRWRYLVVKKLPEWRHEATSLFTIQLLAILFLHIDVIMLGVMASDSDVGVYQLAMQFVFAAALPSWAIAQALAPQFSRSHTTNNLHAFQSQLTLGARLAFFVSVPAFISLLIFAQPLLEILGFSDDYLRSVKLISIVSLGWIVSLLIGPAGTALAMSGNAKNVSKAFALATVLKVLISLPLIYYFNAEGAAVANAITIVVLQISLYAYLYWALGLRATVV